MAIELAISKEDINGQQEVITRLHAQIDCLFNDAAEDIDGVNEDNLLWHESAGVMHNTMARQSDEIRHLRNGNRQMDGENHRLRQEIRRLRGYGHYGRSGSTDGR
jgi:CHAD domain-containing protein